MIRIAAALLVALVLPAHAQDASGPNAEAARDLLREAFGWRCSAAVDGWLADEEPEIYSIEARGDYEDAPVEVFTLYRLGCDSGAYNRSDIWMVAAPDGPPEPIAFALPNTDPVYTDDTSMSVERVDVQGYAAEMTLINSSFDPETRTITSYSKWRGMGDAYESGTWRFEYGRFVLESYEVDPTFDGEQTPIAVFPAE